MGQGNSGQAQQRTQLLAEAVSNKETPSKVLFKWQVTEMSVKVECGMK